MFERFTDRARRVVVLAQEEARLLNHNYIGTEHLLLGLIHEGEGIAAQALEELGISLEAVRHEVERIIGEGGEVPTGHIPFTPRAKQVLELALREALQLGHNYIGTEHILLGLVREGEGVAAQVLVKLGADLSRTRQQVVMLLSSRPPSGEPGTAATAAAMMDPTIAGLMAQRAAGPLVARPDRPVFQALVQVREEMRALTLEALIACWDGDMTALESQLGDVVWLAAMSHDEAQLARLSDLVEIDDALQGVVRLRPRAEPT